MRKKTFKRFLKEYAMDMNNDHSLSLFKNEKSALKDLRAFAVFSFYVFFNLDVTKRLLEHQYKLPNLYKMHCTLKKKYENTTLENVSEVVAHLDDFDELKQLYTSYHNLYVKKDEMVKKLYHQKITNLQTKKQISNYRIYTDLKLNHGNTNDYLKNAHYNKLSIKNIKAINAYVETF